MLGWTVVGAEPAQALGHFAAIESMPRLTRVAKVHTTEEPGTVGTWLIPNVACRRGRRCYACSGARYHWIRFLPVSNDYELGTMNWDNPRSKDLLDDNEMPFTSMKVLQSYVSSLSKSHQALRF